MTSGSFVRFLLLLLGFSLLLAAIGLFPFYYWNNELMRQAMVYNTLFFFIVTLVTYPILAWTIEHRSKKFMNYMFGSILAKMMISLVYIVILIGWFEEERLGFVLSFFVTYILFTGFEVYLLLLNLRQNSQRLKDVDKNSSGR